MTPTDHDTDQGTDPFATDLAARLHGTADRMNPPPDGRERIASRVRHRRNRRRAAVLGSVAVFAVAVIAVAGVIDRHTDADDARVTDTTPTTSTPVPTTSLAVPPSVEPANDLPLLLPGDGYTWGVRAWGAQGFELLVDEAATDEPAMLFSGGVSNAIRPKPDTPGFEEVDVEGSRVVVDRGAGNKASAWWKPTPSTQASILAGPVTGGGATLADSILRLVGSLRPATQDEVRAAAASLVVDPRSMFALGEHEVWLQSLSNPSRTPGDAMSQATFQIWSPTAGWGHLSLTVTPDADPEVRRPGRTAQAGVREVTLEEITGGPIPIRTATWVEDGSLVQLGYGTQVSEDEVLDIVDRLHRPDEPELDDLLLPDWRPSGLELLYGTPGTP